MKVLIATDGSTHAETAMGTSARLLNRDQLTCDVLSVASELVPAGTGNQELRTAYAEHAVKRSTRIAEAGQRLLNHQGWKSRTLVQSGSPADAILERAPEYDLVVVGCHGEYDRKKPGIGPVSSTVVQQARSSVLVGRDLINDDAYRILVGLDGSYDSFHALRSLPRYLRHASIDVTLMHVMEMPWVRPSIDPWLSPDIEGDLSEWQRRLETVLKSEGEAIIDRGLRFLEGLSASATTIIEQGDPGLELASHAEEGDYDLIVVGSSGKSDIKHALLGSVSLKLAWDAPCSVLVVRP